MSPRRRHGRRPGAPTPEPPRGGRPPRRRTGRFARLALALAAVLALVAAGTWAWRLVGQQGRGPLAVPGAAPENDAIARLDPDVVFRTADSLGRAGRHRASLPYYRQALRNVRADFWQLHFNYGSALYNATLEIETANGLPVYALRSSWERVACMREALQQILAAEQLARTPHDLALVRATRARMLWLWGLPWETFAAFRESQAADPADRALAVQGDRYMDLLRDPRGSRLMEPDARAAGPR
jgi:hypothetical protein